MKPMPLTMDHNNLECHFKWHPVDIDEEVRLDKMIQTETASLNESDELKPFTLNLIGYLYTRITPPDYNKALEHFDEVLVQTDETDADKGHKYITIANKIQTLNCLVKKDEIAKLVSSLEEFDTLPSKAKAVVYGHRGYMLTHFGMSNYLPSTEAYSASMKLDPQNYLWPLGSALAAGKYRRIKEGIRSLSNKFEENNLRKAVILSCEQKVLPIIRFAELLFNDARDFCIHSPTGYKDAKLMEEAGKWFEKAYQLNPQSPDMLMRYGKFLNVNGEYEKGIAMLKDACELNPHNSQSWFRLGQAYRFSNIPDLDKAEEYHLKAVTVGYRRYFFAELDLGWIRYKKDNNYDLIKHFEEMRAHYANDDNRQGILDNQIQNVKDILSRRQEQPDLRGQRSVRQPSGNNRRYGRFEGRRELNRNSMDQTRECTYQPNHLQQRQRFRRVQPSRNSTSTVSHC